MHSGEYSIFAVPETSCYCVTGVSKQARDSKGTEIMCQFECICSPHQYEKLWF